jgi:hypothetical protein
LEQHQRFVLSLRCWKGNLQFVRKLFPQITNMDNNLLDDILVPVDSASMRYRSIGLIRFPTGNKSELVYSILNRSVDVLHSDIVNLLVNCNQFKLISDHAEESYRSLQTGREQMEYMISQFSAQVLPAPIDRLLTLLKGNVIKGVSRRESAQVDFIRGTLKQLAQAGFMISERELASLFRQNVEGDAVSSDIRTIGIVQQDQGDNLRRCLTSYIENTKKYGRNNAFVVVDGSQSSKARKMTRHLLQSLSNYYDVMIAYAGLEEKVSYAKNLIANGLPAEAVKFALFGLGQCENTLGANRNAMLLHTVGEMIFSADGGSICSTCDSQDFINDLALDSRPDPTELTFYLNHEDALDSVVEVETDILAAHEKLLGRKIGGCIYASTNIPEINIDNIDWRFVQSLRSGEGRILITMNGIVGDSSMNSVTDLLRLTREPRKRVMRSESAYRAACNSRAMIRAARRTTISNSPFCTTIFIGLDNRSLLPPFLPVNNIESVVFGITLLNCFEPVYLGHLPLLLANISSGSRHFSPDGSMSHDQQQCRDLIHNLIESVEFKPGHSSGRERMQATGEQLMEKASMPLQDFIEFARVQRWRHLSRQIVTLEHLLQAYERTPDFWAKDVERYIDVLHATLKDESYGLPPDNHDHDIGGSYRRAQHLVFNFGQMLYWWPEIVDVAKSLRAQEQRLAVML